MTNKLLELNEIQRSYESLARRLQKLRAASTSKAYLRELRCQLRKEGGKL